MRRFTTATICCKSSKEASFLIMLHRKQHIVVFFTVYPACGRIRSSVGESLRVLMVRRKLKVFPQYTQRWSDPARSLATSSRVRACLTPQFFARDLDQLVALVIHRLIGSCLRLSLYRCFLKAALHSRQELAKPTGRSGRVSNSSASLRWPHLLQTLELAEHIG